MRRLNFETANLGKLYDELAAAGILPTIGRYSAEELEAGVDLDPRTRWLLVPDDADDATVASVIAAHDATAHTRVVERKMANDLSKLHDELVGAGITVIALEGTDDAFALTVAADAPAAAIKAVLAAHDPAPRPQGKRFEERLAEVLAAAPEFSQTTRAALGEILEPKTASVR